MGLQNKMIDPTRLVAGDIILCYTENTDRMIDKIVKVTDSHYTHTAICIDGNMAAESGSGGIQKESIENIINRYPHVAILRQYDPWSSRRIGVLNNYIDGLISKNANYNWSGAKNFSKQKSLHEATLTQKLGAYFEGELKPESTQKGDFFCSELVVNALEEVGLIQESAAIMYKGDTYSPGDLAKDSTFGIFLGYISTRSDYEICETDYFFNHTTLDELLSLQEV